MRGESQHRNALPTPVTPSAIGYIPIVNASAGPSSRPAEHEVPLPSFPAPPPPSPLNPKARLSQSHSPPTSPPAASASSFVSPPVPSSNVTTQVPGPVTRPTRSTSYSYVPAAVRRPSTGNASISEHILPHSTLPQHPHTRPAHTRPAFSTRPSLPSLSTLARMDIPVSALPSVLGVPVKVKKRKGKVGAGLPLEPWDTPTSSSSSPITSPSGSSTPVEAALVAEGGELIAVTAPESLGDASGESLFPLNASGINTRYQP